MGCPHTIRIAIAVAVVSTMALGGVVGPVVAQQEDCTTDCVDPGTSKPEAVPGGGVAFDTPVVLFLKAKKAFNEGFEEFLKAKKAF